MCGVGEETGELEETLDNVADYYANEAEYRVQRLLAALEPTLLVLRYVRLSIDRCTATYV